MRISLWLRVCHCVLAGVWVGACGTDSPDQPGVGGGGSDSLVRTEPEPSGAHCPDGGVAIHTGSDTDDDGVLDAGEVERTEYVCAPGRQVTRVDTERAGHNCVIGGVAIRTGVDRNGNQVLDDDEVTATEYQCGTVWDGDLTIFTADLRAYQGIEVVTGNVEFTRLNSNTPRAVTLPALRYVGGDLLLSGSNITAYSLPALNKVGGHLNGELLYTVATVDLPKLRSAQAITLASPLRALAQVKLGALEQVSQLEIGATQAVDLSSLVHAGSLELSGTVELPALVDADALTVESGAISAPELSIVRGQLTLFGVSAASLPKLRFVGRLLVENTLLQNADFPALTSAASVQLFHNVNLTRIALDVRSVKEWVVFHDHPRLETIVWPNLEKVEQMLQVTDNPALASLDALTKLTSVGNLTVLGGNMQRVGLPALQEAKTIIVRNDPVLQTLDLPALREVTSLWVTDLAAVTAYDLPALDVVRSSVVTERSPRMPTCRADELLGQLSVAPSSTRISDTDNLATCE